MSRMRGVGPLSLTLAWLGLVAGCGSESKQPLSCHADAECPSGAYCLGGACIAGQLPEAHIRVAGGELVSHRQVLFDGSGSVDPNPQHRLTAYRWALRRASASACDPSPAAGSEDKLSTVFRCAGDYQVELTVKNSLGLESASIAQAVSVGPSANPPTIDSQSPDLVLAHRCAGAPLACEAQDAAGQGSFQLAITAHDVEDGQALAYRWEVDPPPGADRAAAHLSDPTSAAPTVRIASSGGRIGGTWTFRALVTDGDALVTPAEIEVTVDDEAPIVTPALPVAGFDHAFADNVYRVHGLVRYAVEDADGDAPQVTAVALRETPATSCQSTLTPVVKPDGGVEVTVDLTCVSPDELSPTVGGATLGAGVAREVEVTVGDGQGAEATVTLPFQVHDRAPGLSAAVATTDHGAASCPFATGACFSAAGSVPAPLDPDGDPVALVSYQPQGLDGHDAWSSDGLGGFTLLTDHAAPASFRDASGRSPVTVAATVRDPWQSATASFELQIPNRPPVASSLAIRPVASYDGGSYLAQGTAALFADPDGDPVVSAVTGHAACSGTVVPDPAGAALEARCTRAWGWTTNGWPELGAFTSAPFQLAPAAADAWERGAASSAALTPVAPAAPTLKRTRESVPVTCLRVCPPGEPCEYQPVGGCVAWRYTPPVVSPVPVYVTAQASSGERATFDCWNGSCAGALDLTVCGSATVTVTLADGYSVAASYAVSAQQSCP